MARTGKYTHGKTKGTSDRQSSRRTSAAPGETGGVIKDFRLSGPGESQKIRTNTQDYFQSQPLNVPAAIKIPDALEIPDNSQNLKNLANAFGNVNTNLQSFLTEFPKYQGSLDKQAREIAEIKVNANVSLNDAKKVLEQKSETDAETANSYGIFASMDQRVEREYGVVLAKREGMDAITSFPDVMEDLYQNSFTDKSRKDANGTIIPLNPSTPEFTQFANKYFETRISNPQARLELQPQIQAAIYSARRSISATHKEYKDTTAVDGKNNNIGIAILDASTLSQETLSKGFISTEWTTDQEIDEPGVLTEYEPISFTKVYNDFNQQSGVSMKTYNQATRPDQIVSDVAEQVVLVSNNAGEVKINANIGWELLKNTKLGAGEGIKLIDMYGEKKLRRMWDIAIGKQKNEASRILDTADIKGAQRAAEADFGTINQQDADMSTPEIDPILNGDSQRTVTVKGEDYFIPSGANAINITGTVGKINKLQFDAYNKFATVQEAQAYIQRLEQVKQGFLDGRTAGQREENYLWLEKITEGSPDQATRNQQLINYFYRTKRIDSDQYQLLNSNINPNYVQEKANYNTHVSGDNGVFQRADGYIEGYWTDKTKISTRALDTWEDDDRTALAKEKAAFRTEATRIFNMNIPYGERIDKIDKLLSDKQDEIKERRKELKENRTGKSEDNIQVGTNKQTNNNQTNNNQDDTQSFTYQTPRELINDLAGGLDGRGNPQENSSLVTAVREDTLYSTPILAHQLEQIEDLAIVLENKNIDGNSINVWGWIQGVEGTTAVRGPKALSYTREMPAILRRINKDMSPKEFFILQAKLHNRPLSAKFYERLDRVFPDERNSQFQFQEVKKNNELSSSISDQGTLIASTDLSGILKKEPTPPPRIDPSDDKDLYPKGIEAGSYVLPKDVTDDKKFVSEVEKLSTELKIPVNYLWAVMGFETGGTFDPAEYNKGPDGTKESGSGAVGLIQFMPATLKEWGVTTEQAAKMTRVEQLELVKKHLKRWTRPGDDFRDVYMSILFPVAAGKPNDYVLFTKGTKEKPNTRYDQNIGLDKNKDGTITKEEAASSILQYLPPLPVKEVPKNKDSSTIGGRSNIA